MVGLIGNKLKFEDLTINMVVIDENENAGTVIECDDPHNILVSFENGNAFYCFVDDCDERYDKLYRPRFNPANKKAIEDHYKKTIELLAKENSKVKRSDLAGKHIEFHSKKINPSFKKTL